MLAQRFLGIGAQKAGTTWLHYYFMGHPQIAVSNVKELHYFDVKYCPDACGHFLAQRKRVLSGAIKLNPKNQDLYPMHYKASLKESVARLVEITEAQDDKAYWDFIQQQATSETLAYGEFTPSYSLIEAEDWHEVATNNPNTKIIFVMRDPLDRLFSAAKMEVRDHHCDELETAFFKVITDPEHLKRSYYHKVIEGVEAAFGRENVFIAFYEALFNDVTIWRLTQFLGVDFVWPRYNRSVNASPGFWSI